LKQSKVAFPNICQEISTDYKITSFAVLVETNSGHDVQYVPWKMEVLRILYGLI